MGQGIRARRIRDAVGISCGVLVVLGWIVFANIILPRHDFTVGQFTVTILWLLGISGALCRA